MELASKWRYLLTLTLVWLAVGVVFWMLNARYASDQLQAATRASAASLSSTNWAIDFYTLRTREAIAVLASDIGADMLSMADDSAGLDAAAQQRVSQAFGDWIGRYRNFHSVSAISSSGMELVRYDRWGDEIMAVPADGLRDQAAEPSVQEALSARPGRPVRSVTALLMDSPFPQARGATGSKVVLGLGGENRPAILLSATLDSGPITEFLVGEASDPPDQYLFVIRMDGVIAVGDALYSDYEYATQRGVEGDAAKLLPELWRAMQKTQGNGELSNDAGLYVFRTMVAPNTDPELPPQASGEAARQLPSSVLVVFHPSSALAAGNPFAGPTAWAGFLLIDGVIGLFALGFWRLQRQKQTLQAVTDAQSHALGVVKYELHTPAAAIDMLIDSGDRGPERWNQLASASKHLLAIIDDLRLSITPDRNNQERESAIAIRPLTMEVDRQLTPLLASRGQSLRYELPDWADNLYRGQYFLFRVTITNLIRYAATQSNGRQIRLSFDRSEGNDVDALTVNIDTDGISLTPEEIERLFLPFDDVGRLGPISGISLHMIQQWIEDLDGEVTATTSAKGGIAFRLCLPLARVTEGALSDAEVRFQTGAHHALSGHSILLVEDDSLLGPLVEEVLTEQFGLDVERFNSGEAALTRLGSRRFDMLLVDYYMPGMDGLRFTRTVRESDAAVPVIGMCGGEDAYTEAQFQSAGADYVVVKPITRKRFDEAMTALEGAGRLKFQRRFPT